MSKVCFLPGNRIYLRPLLISDINNDYLSWLNDSEVNLYSGRRFFPSSEFKAKEYLANLKNNEAVLAICTNDQKHIGNIKFGPIKWIHKSVEISIMIGDKTEWNKGYAKEAIYLVTKHLFQTLGLNRVEAGTVNPAFQKSVEKLGWKQDGILRSGYFFNNQFKDIIRLSILKSEFKVIPNYEKDYQFPSNQISSIQQPPLFSKAIKDPAIEFTSKSHSKYHAAVIGCGNIASKNSEIFNSWPITHCAAYHKHPNTNLVAISDLDLSKAKNCAEKWDISNYYSSHHQILANHQIDIISICTPPEFHAPIIKDIVNSKKQIKAIFCEKPFASNLNQAQELKKLCEENNIILAINFQRRYDKFHQYVREHLTNLVGVVKKAIFLYAGGISNNGSHAFDLLEFYFGKTKSLHSIIDENEDKLRSDPNLSVQINFESNITAHLIPCTIDQHSLFELQIIGTKGQLTLINLPFFGYDYRYFPNTHSTILPTVSCSSSNPEFPIPKDFSRDLFENAIEDIIQTIESNEKNIQRELLSSAENGVSSMQIVSAAIFSANEQKNITMPFTNSIELPKTNGVFKTWKIK